MAGTTVEEMLVRQAGVISRAQALACGMSARTIARRVSAGAWCALHPGVYLVAGHRLTPEARVRAAWLWAGERSTLSGPAAAFWHGMLPSVPGQLDLTVPRPVRRTARPGVRLRRRTLARDDRVPVRGIVVTSPALTVLETAGRLVDGAAFLDRALQRHVRPGDLQGAYARVVGAHGTGRAGRLLVAAMDRADSAAERHLLRLLHAAAVPGAVRAVPFGIWHIDIAFPAASVAVEVDGWAWHVDPDRFHADRRKQNELVAAGWTVLRFTWSDIAERPAATVARVRAAVVAGTARTA